MGSFLPPLGRALPSRGPNPTRLDQRPIALGGMSTSHHLLPLSGKGCFNRQGSLQQEASKTCWSFSILLWPRLSRKAWRPRGRGWRYQVLTATPIPLRLAVETAMAFRGSDPSPSILLTRWGDPFETHEGPGGQIQEEEGSG